MNKYTGSRVMAVHIYYYLYSLYMLYMSMYDLCMFIRFLVSITQVLHHQPINDPTAGAQACFMGYL
jgi:hypothetical protein